MSINVSIGNVVWHITCNEDESLWIAGRAPSGDYIMADSLAELLRRIN